ncbi:MAG TPA: AMP-binding protein [Candidatus Dormibacteraeota bacterium]
MEQSHWTADASSPVLETTIGGLLRDAASTAGDRTALIAGVPEASARRALTFSETLTQAERVAAALLARFEPGERVAVWAPNTVEWILLEYGAALAGITLVTVNPAYRPSELEFVLKQSRAAGIFLLPEWRSNPMAAALDSVRTNLPALREAVLFTEWEEFLATHRQQERLPQVTPDDPVQIQYTSGTTGFPKGAVLHHRGVTNNARFYVERLRLQPEETMVSPMPLFHTAGCFMGVLGALQARAALVPVLMFEPGLVLELIESTGASAFCGVPTMLVALLESVGASGRDLSRLRVVVSGGSVVPAELARRLERELGVTFVIVFGTTECSPLVTQTALDDSEVDRVETLGRPLPQVDVMIAAPDSGSPVPVGEVGELCARGYQVMTGYNDNLEGTAAAIDSQGWYHTGDLASMDARGYLRIEGRLKDMIIRGGENIYPREIEDALGTHPAVAEVAVVGVPDERWGEIVAAFVRLSPNLEATEAELLAHCRARLAPYKLPVRWEFVDAFPMTGSGKIQKFKLKESAAVPAAD